MLLLSSLLLFALSSQERDVGSLVLLVGVLFFHEVGHLAGMLLFGYRDVRMFFIPFFGAAVSGKSEGVAPWKRGAVLLLGPLPGLVLACALAGAAPASPLPWMRSAQTLLIGVNALNLLPFEPLDGGRLVRLTLSSRHWLAALITEFIAALALVAIGLHLQSYALGILGAFGVIGIASRRDVLRAAAALRARRTSLPERLDEASDAQLRAIFDEVLRAFPPLTKAGGALPGKITAVTNLVRAVHTAAIDATPSALASVALLAAQASGFLLIALAFSLGPARRGGAAASPATPGIFEPLSESKATRSGLVTAHYPASFSASNATEDPKRDAIILGRSLPDGAGEALSFTAVASPVTGDVADFARRAEAGHAQSRYAYVQTSSSPASCNGYPGIETVGTFQRRGGGTSVRRTCYFLQGEHGYAFSFSVTERYADAETPVLLQIREAAEITR